MESSPQEIIGTEICCGNTIGENPNCEKQGFRINNFLAGFFRALSFLSLFIQS
jgi:hypothetical protein